MNQQINKCCWQEMMSVQLTELNRHVRAEKKSGLSRTSNFRKQIVRVLFRDLQIIGRKAPANGCYPVPELSDSEAKTPPIPRIASCCSSDNKKIETFRHMRKIYTPAFPEWLLSSVCPLLRARSRRLESLKSPCPRTRWYRPAKGLVSC